MPQRRRRSREPSRRASLALLGTLTALALAFRLPLLFAGLWRDEASTFFDIATPTVAGLLREVRLTEITPPGYFLLMRGWVALFGVTDVTLKLPSLVFGVALIPATYALARLLGSRSTALVAAAFAACSTAGVALSTEARSYTLAALLAALGLAAGLRYVSGTGAAATLAGYAACALALEYVHYTGGLLLAAFALGSLVFAWEAGLRRRVAAFACTNVAVAAVFLPWLPFVRKVHETTFLQSSDGSNVFGRFIEQFGFVLPVDFMHVQYAFVSLAALVAVPLARYARSRSFSNLELRRSAVTVTLLVGTWLETVLLLHEQRYMFVFSAPANALFATLCLALVVPVLSLARLERARSSPLRIGLGVLFIGTIVSGAPTQVRTSQRLYGADRSGVKRLVADSGSLLDARTLVVVAPDYLGPSVGYYLRGRPDLTIVGVPNWHDPEHSRCCDDPWRSETLVNDTVGRIRAAAPRYDRIAYLYDTAAYDEGPVRYSRVTAIRSRLTTYYPVLAERRNGGTKERAGLTLFAVRRL